MDLPSFGGNWVDLIILLIFIFYTACNLSRGFIIGAVDLGGFLLSFLCAFKFYNFFGELLVKQFSFSKGIANAFGFLVAGILTEIFLSFLINTVIKYVHPKFASHKNIKPVKLLLVLNKYFGVIPAAGETVIIISFLLTLFISLPVNGNIKKSIIESKIGGRTVKITYILEKQINNIFGQAVNETLNFLTVNSNPQLRETVNLGFTQNEYKIDTEAEQIMLGLINQERAKSNRRILSVNLKAQQSARKHAIDMFNRGYFSHNNLQDQSPFDRLKTDGVNFLAAGENLAFAPNVNLAHQGLMNSPGHRANILSADFGKIGIGVIDGGIYGEMFVQEFTD